MLNSLLLTGSLICYLSATVLIARYIRVNSDQVGNKQPLTIASFIALIGVIAHLVYSYNISFIDQTLNFSTHSMMVLISAVLVSIYLLASLLMPIRRLGVLVFPLVILSLLFALLWDSSKIINLNASIYLTAHILISILAYSLLTIATVQSLLYLFQERQIKQRTKPTMLLALPPLQTMEQLLFRLISVGFIFLTLTLFSGAIFSQEIFGQAFVFKHHTILAFLGWIMFAIVLFKRFRQGIRGSQAVILICVGFLLIQLGYFGTKIVSESIALN